MAKKFVRNITNTDISKEPLWTNLQNDILSDDKNAYIRNGNDYYPLTKSISEIKAGNSNIKITRKKDVVTITPLSNSSNLPLSTPKEIRVSKDLKKDEDKDSITLSLSDLTSNKIKNIPKIPEFEVKPPLVKTVSNGIITFSLLDLPTPKNIKVLPPLIRKENNDNITLSLKNLITKGIIQKKETEEDIELTAEIPKIEVISPLTKKEENGIIRLGAEINSTSDPSTKKILVKSPLLKSEDDKNITLSLDSNFNNNSNDVVNSVLSSDPLKAYIEDNQLIIYIDSLFLGKIENMVKNGKEMETRIKELEDRQEYILERLNN